MVLALVRALYLPIGEGKNIMKRPFHKMTATAATARQLCADLYGLEVSQMRKDHAAIHGMYAELEERGYEWVVGKQEWALMAGKRSPFEPTHARFVFAAEGVTGAEGQYILVEGLKAAGYEVTDAHLVYDLNNPEAIFIHVEVKL
jgi:hypothetical protein